MTEFIRRLFFGLLLVSATFVAVAEPDQAPPPVTPTLPVTPTTPIATDPSYHLSPGDTISITVYNEPDLSITQTLGHSGEARVYLIGQLTLGGKTVRDAEQELEKTYRDRQLLKDPVVILTVTSYFPREISVLGAVRTPGTVVFPRDATTIDIVEVITLVGGFLPISKSDAVTITHRSPDGKETVTTVNLENTISGRHQSGKDRADIAIYPGDRIWVPERLF